MELIHIAYGGPTRRISDAKGKVWRFEDHPVCGPVVVDRHDDPKDDQPPEGSPFWDAVTHWAQQGKRLIDGAHGPCCVWDKPTPQKMRHIGGMHYVLVPDDKVPNAEVTSRSPRAIDKRRRLLAVLLTAVLCRNATTRRETWNALKAAKFKTKSNASNGTKKQQTWVLLRGPMESVLRSA